MSEPLDLDELARLEQAATDGPWEAYSRDVSGRLDSDDVSGLGWEIEGPPEPRLRGQYGRGEDAVFIVAMRNAAPALIAQVRALRAALEWYADESRYARQEERSTAGSDGRLLTWHVAPVEKDRGEIARKALGWEP